MKVTYLSVLKEFVTADKATGNLAGKLMKLAEGSTVEQFLDACKLAEGKLPKGTTVPRNWIDCKSVVKAALQRGITGSTYNEVRQAVVKARKAEKGTSPKQPVGPGNTDETVPVEIREAIHSLTIKTLQLVAQGRTKEALIRLAAADTALGKLLEAVMPVEPVAKPKPTKKAA